MSALPALSSVFRLGMRPLGRMDCALSFIGTKSDMLTDAAGMMGDLCSVASNSSWLAKRIISSSNPNNKGLVNSSLGGREPLFIRVDSMLSGASLVSEGAEALGLWGRFLTGHMFWETNSNGQFKYAAKGNPDGTIDIERCPRSCWSIIGKTAALVGRTTGFVTGLHDQKIVNLGQHAKRLGYSSGVAFFSSAIQSMSKIVESTIEYKEAKDTYNIISNQEGFKGDFASETERKTRKFLRERVICIISSILNLIALPLGVGLVTGLGATGATASAVICLLASVLNLYRDFCES